MDLILIREISRPYISIICCNKIITLIYQRYNKDQLNEYGKRRTRTRKTKFIQTSYEVVKEFYGHCQETDKGKNPVEVCS